MKISRRPLLSASALALLGCGEQVTRDGSQLQPYNRLKPGGEVPGTLVVGATPFKGADTIRAVGKLAAFLEKKLNMKVRPVVAEEYGALEREVAAKRVHVGIFSPAAYTHAQKTLKAIPIATASAAGSPTYLGYFIIKRRRGGRPRLESFRGKRIAYVHKKSTSGFLFPRDLLRDRGWDPDAFFAPYVIAGDHQKAIDAVVRGEVEVATVSSGFIDSPHTNMPDYVRKLDVIAKTRRIPLDCVVLHQSLQRKLGAKLHHLLVNELVEDRAASHELYSEWGIHGFSAYKARAYDTVAHVIGCETGNQAHCKRLRRQG
jgi:phosphate/phosphite/phosphonate ABC transporter binding protein